jgi:hypothetical protein
MSEGLAHKSISNAYFIQKNVFIISRDAQTTSRQGGADSENFQISRGGGVNSPDLIDNFWRKPQNFFFQKKS